MADLITVEQFATRTRRTFADGSDELAQLEALITDASALIVDTILNDTITADWDAATPSSVPAGVLPVITAMVRRGLDNPHGFTSERSFEYQYQGASDAGVFATDREAKALRRAAGRPGLTSRNLDADLPLRQNAVTDWLEGAYE